MPTKSKQETEFLRLIDALNALFDEAARILKGQRLLRFFGRAALQAMRRQDEVRDRLGLD